MIYRCNDCGAYFDEDDVMSIQPDVGTYHVGCGSDDIECIYNKNDMKHCENDMIDELNDLRSQK